MEPSMTKEEKAILKKALMAEDGGGYPQKTSENIIYGNHFMNVLKKALDMEENYGIAASVWVKLYKKKS